MRAMPANHWKSVRVPFPPEDVEGERGRAAATFRGCCAARHGEFLPLGPVSSKEEYGAGTRLWGGFLVGGGGLAEGGGLGHARTGFTRRRKGGAIANCEMGRGSVEAGRPLKRPGGRGEPVSEGCGRSRRSGEWRRPPPCPPPGRGRTGGGEIRGRSGARRRWEGSPAGGCARGDSRTSPGCRTSADRAMLRGVTPRGAARRRRPGLGMWQNPRRRRRRRAPGLRPRRWWRRSRRGG